ncbi:MAG: hypothetical protein ETSY2_36765 [Candidatus Entotheonella gemina]|uniref:Uncharacterized protein n=1 Tax=Candidatus Entotheonella gemina TaxID=1429439 RepID=W4LUX2_9BACT|nr:hypothetical protein [Candidatus Entotheonella palauensis]ETX01685.1 MAG: hypothetical protein ETSY2_36765 [Candidatus Entotheonella gemina]
MDQQKLIIKCRNLWVWRRFQGAVTALLTLLVTCLGVGLFDVAWAQDPPDNVYLVSYIRSQTTLPLFDTVISLTNVHDDNCPVTVVWMSNSGDELCLTESTIPSNQTHHHCSSQNPEASGVTMACRAVCDASASSLEGHAIVQTVGRCRVRLGVDAKIYSATFMRNVDGRITSTQAIGFHSVEVHRFDGVNLTD